MEDEMKLMKLREVAKYLTISPKTIVEWRYRRKLPIPCYKVGGSLRFKLEDVKKLVVPANNK